MKQLFAAMIIAATAMPSTMVLAAEQTVKLSVPGMTCASCPYIVKQAISAIKGVTLVQTTLDDHSATVTFDDAVASVDAINKATKDIGYESSIISALPKS